MWNGKSLRNPRRAEGVLRDISHASVLVFVMIAAGSGIMASIYMSSQYGTSFTAAFILVAVLFPLVCGLLWKQLWRTKKLEEALLEQGFKSRPGSVITGISSGAPFGLLILSSELRVTFANQTYLQLASRAPEGVLGLKIQEVLIAEGVEDRALLLLEQADPPNMSVSFDTLIRVGLEDNRPVHITMTRIAPEHGRIRILVVVEDAPFGYPEPALPGEGYLC